MIAGSDNIADRAALLLDVVDTSPSAVFVKDLAGHYLLVNKRATEIIGVPEGKILGRTDEDLFPPEVAAAVRRHDREAITAGAPVEIEESFPLPSGERTFLVVRTPLRDSDGEPFAVGGVGIDITDRRRAERGRREAEDRLTIALAAGELGVWEWHIADDRVHWSPECFAIVGTSQEAFRGDLNEFLDRVHSDDRTALWEKVQAALASGSKFDAVFRLHSDNGVRWLKNLGVVHLDESGRPARLVGTVQDVTAHVTLEQSLREREEKARSYAEELQVLMEAMPAAIWIAHDAESRVITGSRHAREILRMPSAVNLSLTAPHSERPVHFKVLERGVEIPPEQLPVQRAARGEAVRDFEEEVVFEDGASVVLFGSAMPLYTQDGKPRGAVSAFVDITAKKSAERLLVQARTAADEANAAKDQFLATVSHELRHPLNTILGYLQMLRAGTVTPDRVTGVLDRIERSARQQGRLIDDLLDLSRMVAGTFAVTPTRIDLVPVIDDVIASVQPSAEKKGLAVIVHHGARELVLDGDGTRLHQLFVNVLSNAVRYTPSGGRVNITTEASGDGAVIVVQDSGVGVAPEFLPRMFERFTQQANPEQRRESGLGVGLAIARHIAEAHGGTITAASDGVDQGTTIRIILRR